MVNAKIIKQLSDVLINDESFCRLILYGENPFSIDFPNIVGDDGWKERMEEYITYSPQSDEIINDGKVRISMYKSTTKMTLQSRSIRNDAVQIDIFAPHFLQKKDLRTYLIEEKISELLDSYNVDGIGQLEYVDGGHIQAPSIVGYAIYKMIFTTSQGRKPKIGKF